MKEDKDINEQEELNEVQLEATEVPEEGDAKPKSAGGVLGHKTIEDVIQREAKEEQDTSSPFSISKTLGGVIIAKAVQRQMGLVLLISAFLIIYISNRYVCQKKMVEIDRLEKSLEAARYKATVCTSILTEKSRESNIMELLYNYGDSTLAIPQDPPYLIRIEE
ncbi:MAG: hypothetical protein II626_00450 [Prevotella sp.]|jgi:hypothetical protein|nr:hypothetical protein [Prevotella sp.]MBQ4041082.1 hypothetical protein [Prevotella sp.]